MAIIKLQVRVPLNSRKSAVSGQLLSLITAVEEVGMRRRKGSFISHFFQERLDKKEKRILISILNQLQNQLLEEKESTNITASSENFDSPLPRIALKTFRKFQLSDQK